MKKCPYCAEEIQEDAIKCKHCGTLLKSKRIPLGIILFSLFIFLTALILILLKLIPSRDPRDNNAKIKLFSKMPKYGSVSGHVYVTVGSGDSHMARGIEVYLITKNTEFDKRMRELASIRNQIISYTSSVFNDIASGDVNVYNALGRASEQIGHLSAARNLSEECIKKSFIFYSMSGNKITKTNFEGEYKFKEIIPSEYYIYAKYQTNFNEGYWLVPITIETNTAITLDLDNSNFFDEEGILKRKEILEYKTTLADHIENLARIHGGGLEAAQTRLMVEKAWNDLEHQSNDRFKYPEPVKESTLSLSSEPKEDFKNYMATLINNSPSLYGRVNLMIDKEAPLGSDYWFKSKDGKKHYFSTKNELDKISRK